MTPAHPKPVHLKPLCLALMLLAAPQAHADAPLWELGFGAATASVPHYAGSDQSRTWVLPVPYVIYRGQFIQSDRDGTRAVLVKQPGFKIDLSAGFSAPVRSADSRARSGMPDLPATLELGPKLTVDLAQGANWKLDLRLPVRAGLALNRDAEGLGFDLSPSLDLQGRVAGWGLGLRTGPSFGSRKRHQYFYGVDAAHANANRPSYSAPAGYSGWRSTMALSNRQDKLWSSFYVSNDTVARASFERSPLVKQNLNWSAGVVLVWVFATSDERVPDSR